MAFLYQSIRVLAPLTACARTALLAVTTAGNPDAYVVRPGSSFDGVALLDIITTGGGSRCSGALGPSGVFVITAAHCVTDESGAPDVISATVYFQTSGGPIKTPASAWRAHPLWSGDISFGADLAIIHLTAPAPLTVPRYEIYRGTDELGRIAVIAGWGRSGTGRSGADPRVYPSGILRKGLNRLDAMGEVFMSAGAEKSLTYDFDDGTALHDGYGYLGVVADAGTGKEEVMIALGDSGGPTFLDGKIAGVHSFRGWVGSPPDSNAIELDGSFGEFGGDTRVSAYTEFVDKFLAVPDVPPFVLVGAGLALILTGILARGARIFG